MANPTYQDVTGTSAWQVGNAGLTQSFSAILAKYGLVPDDATLAKYGLTGQFDPSQAQAARDNPYSIFADLGRARDTGFGQDNYSANSHNALFSGAFQNSIDQTGRDYQQGIGTAGQNELGELMGVGGKAGDLYQTIYGQLLNKPVSPDTSADPAGPGGYPAQTHAAIGTNTPLTTHDEGPAALAQRNAIPMAPKPPKAKTFSTAMGRY